MIDPSASTIATSTTCDEISVRSASAWAASMGLSILRVVPASGDSGVRLRALPGAVVAKFFADRGTHLAAMIAYFALLSFVPLLFLSLSLLGAANQADQGSFFVRELQRTFPSTSVDSILHAVRAIQANATALGIVGAAFLLWSSLSLFSVLESAFNIVYGRPNRGFLRGKALASLMMVGSLVVLFAALVVGSVGAELLRRHASVVDNAVVRDRRVGRRVAASASSSSSRPRTTC